MAVVRIGIGAASPPARAGRDTFLKYLDTLEAQGWDSLWFSDRIVGPGWVIDPIVGMSMIAAHTKKLKFGTSVLLMSVRSPVAMARALGTIDFMSNGRLILGVGVGQEADTEYVAMGVRKNDRGKRLDEAIMLMRRLWTEDKVTHASPFTRLADAQLYPKPAQANVPIWIGGRTEAAIKRTGLMGDGWLPTQVTVDEVARGIAQVRRYAADAGRQVPDDHFGVQLGCYIVENGPVPMDKVGQHLLRRRTDVGLEQLHLLGTAEQVNARLRELIDAGATKFVLNPACGMDELWRQLELQSELVVRPWHAKKDAVGAG
ncbi:MAG: TIGR03619 family F420-dependent LLM class oxidoreductase [SAR202 cluster bacterium]|nr:TIGR03619 family F420-dependent LLM class oxidoreductase [SAR202 cluster bacterium]